MNKRGKAGLGRHMGVSWDILAHFTSKAYPLNCCQVLRNVAVFVAPALEEQKRENNKTAGADLENASDRQ